MNTATEHIDDHNHDPQMRPVRFEYTSPTATAVSVAGTFNNWQPHTQSMHRTENGHWLLDSVLAPGNYEYRFVVDDQWIPDPLAKRSVPNPFGGMNSVLTCARVFESSEEHAE